VKIGGNSEILVDDYKRSSEILAEEKRKICWEKIKLGTFSMESYIFLEIGGNLEQGGNASLPQGDGRPCLRVGSGK